MKQSVYHLSSRNRRSRVNFRRRDVLQVTALIVLSTLVPGVRLALPAMAKSQNRLLAPGEAMALIKDLGDTAVAMLSNKSLNHADKMRQFRYLLNESFALKGIARFALGRYWRKADIPQRRRYLQLFEDYIVNSYAARFRNYDGEEFIILGENVDNRGGAVVTTRIQRPGGGPVEILWHLQERLGVVRIVDVMIEGISMSLTQRSDFAASVRTTGGDLDKFLDTLEITVRNFKPLG